ncbi:putative inorganic carbon transporter subunit DabA [Pseudidiomarina halophila]|uniref:putative inorganic carbon transporter subunit DabA n=1 Tax=Pseudidiomarina halophila TaxID=1449799 RepID=UPI00361E5EEC
MQLQKRAGSWAEVRPEWGLARNAAIIFAPRTATRNCHFDARAFLHDYHADRDPEQKILTQLMTAPMVVAHWINMQYYASTVAPQQFGSGNKLLHNVVADGLGVFEGNGGDIRIGLSKQSLHDGRNWYHEPLRLTVVIAASQAAIDRVIAEQPVVRQLIENEWLYLWQWQPGQQLQPQQRSADGWQAVANTQHEMNSKEEARA